jgi:glucose/arabinose dehydrogenase
LGVTLVADGLREPVYVAAPPGDSRLFVVERSGRILVMSRDGSSKKIFLDASSLVSTFGSERGMLGLAFHPQYAQNGRFFVTYTGLDGGVHLDRYEVSGANADAANAASRAELLDVAAPGTSHYGGMIAFTPDGNLLMSVGEGAAFAEPGGQSQNPRSLLGKILRLDVDHGQPYAIPAGNPYEFRDDGAPEVWALGLRNPWRFSIDPTTRQLFLADVGDNSYEEVNIVPVDEGGLNYGWSFFEGPTCQYSTDLCTSAEFHTPEVEYTHQPPCTSITGGIVYRGDAIPEHRGRYFYSDYCLGWIRSLRYEGGQVTEALDWATSLPSSNIVSFGEDGFHELYAVSLTGRIYRLGGTVESASKP